ncbi:MAG: EpsI family protein [Candidatus Eisenbacteria bacterium]|nr:EpsI family protein [Candidatus Eisenbacteria bacterium]
MNAVARVAIVSILLLGAAAYVYLNPPDEMAVVPGTLAGFPMRLSGWSGEERNFDDVVIEELDADDVLSRKYTKDDQSLWFIVIFHQNERYGAHDPLVCYRSQGWSVVDEGTVALSRPRGRFDANWALFESRGHRRLALYWWYTAGDLATGDRDQFFARMARSGIVSNVTFGAFIRVSTVVVNDDVAKARETVVAFAEEALRHLPALFEVE